MAQNSTHQGLAEFIRAGLAIARQKPGIALLLYAVNGVVSLIVAIPAFFAVQRALGDTGWGSDLAREFNLPVWTDIWNILFRSGADGGVAPEIRILTTLFFVAVPIMWLWKALSSVGVINAVRDGGMRGFWSGVGTYGGRALTLAIPWFLISLIALGAVGFALSLIASSIRTEKAVYWSFMVALPVLSVLVLAVLDLMHDYGRIGIVARDEKPSKAFFNGVATPFSHPRSMLVYGSWLLIAVVLMLIPPVLDAWMTSGTWLGLIVLILLQQSATAIRACATVGWFGSEVAYFEAIRFHDEPLIADQQVADLDAAEQVGLDPAEPRAEDGGTEA